MHSVVPDAKLIYMVRDPLERIAAHWVHNYAKRREKGDLRATLTHPNTSYVVRSQYHMQLAAVPRALPARADRSSSSRRSSAPRREETLRRVFEFVGVDPGFSHPRFGERAPPDLAQDARHAASPCGSSGSSRTRGGRVLPTNVWLALDERLPLRRPIERPDVRLAARRRDVCRSCARTPSGCAS